jgi:ATP-dependent DNA helicase RecG
MPTITLPTPLTDIFRLTDAQKSAARKLALETVDDLLRWLPARYINASNLKSIAEIKSGEHVAIEGKVTHLDAKKTFQKRLNITEARIADNTGEITAVWFHQPYVSRMLAEDDLVRLEGKAALRKGQLYISNPMYEKISVLSFRGSGARMIPVYPTTRGISSRWIQYHISKVFQEISSETITDPIPEEIRARYHLPDLYATLRAAHFPKNEKEVEAARKRLAFEEIFFIQLARMRERIALEETSSLPIPRNTKALNEFLNHLPFQLTKTQTSILDTILADIARKTPMARLVEGDVGSGKTIIAAAASYMALRAGFQATYMAPTEILARQHFDSFAKLVGSPAIKIGLITSSEARVYPSKAFRGDSAHIPKSQMLRWAETGEIKILLGTHALLSEKIKFKNLALIVVDEQHRFGVSQRMRLAHAKSKEHAYVPHFLSMTATPIPRTLALTVFGDLDLSILDELPPGRASITTEVLIKPESRSWDHIRREIEKGRQAFIICPRIEEDNGRPTSAMDVGRPSSRLKSVKREYERISKEIFPEFKTAMLHGKMTPRDKEKTLADFRAGKINILISTTVIEVGIDIPNATIMIVEGADRFGLAQLHQLRGRIGRGEHQSYFFAVTDSGSQKTIKRLHALRDAANGFELAEYDLQLRGPGELTGRNQWGMSDIGMEALKNIKMVEAARAEARALLAKDRELKKYPILQEKLSNLNQGIYHFE